MSRAALLLALPAVLSGLATPPGALAAQSAVPSSADTSAAAATASSDSALAEHVRASFRHAWNGYKQYAWGHDELKPISKAPHDWYATSLLMTPVDSYDTMLLMGLHEEAAEAKALIRERLSSRRGGDSAAERSRPEAARPEPRAPFDLDLNVQVFEVVIRLLGGLLSSYQLDGDSLFLGLATDLGNRLLPAFGSPTGMPFRYVNLRTGATSGPVSNPAEIGTLMLEFGTLSRLTGNPAYYENAKRAVSEVYRRRSSSTGLVGTTIDVRTGEWQNRNSHVSGAIDSYYEYLLKSWLLFGDRDFEQMWRVSIDAVHEHLLDDRFSTLWYGHAHMDTGQRASPHFGALDAFLPGVLALAGDTARAERLMLSVYRMWATFGIEPEVMDYEQMSVVHGGYPLRPESIESAWYLYRLTGNPLYRDMGRHMYDALVRAARTDAGFAAIADVRTGELKDEQPSFLLAETFKYAWLLFAPPHTIDLHRVVFNTEAHPLARVAR